MSVATENKESSLAPPLARVNQLQPIIELLQSQSLPWDKILKRAQLPASVMDKPNALIPEVCIREVISLTGEFMDVENIGFYIGQNIPRLPPLTFDNQAKTVAKALESFCHHMHLYASNTDFSLHAETGGAWFCRVDPLKISATTITFEQYMTAAFIRVVQSLSANDNWKPSQVRFSYVGPDNIKGFNEKDSQMFFEADHTAIFIDNKTLLSPVNQDYLKQNPVFGLMDNLDEKDVIDGIEEIFCTYLEDEVISGDFVSSAMLSTPRQLQRQLEKQGTTFRKIRNNLLYREARIMLADKNKSISEITNILGYSDATNFVRAFSTWSGYSPGYYREHYLKRT